MIVLRVRSPLSALGGVQPGEYVTLDPTDGTVSVVRPADHPSAFAELAAVWPYLELVESPVTAAAVLALLLSRAHVAPFAADRPARRWATAR